MIPNRIIQGDALEVLKGIPADSFDSCVTDPPYGLGFMGKAWDKSGIANNVDLWREVLRVLKPGAHLLSFGGSRTYHRMACAIEDAGFEIRDQIMWIYGSGFPKSLDVSKAIDKAAGAEREVIEQVRVKGGGMEHVNRTNAATHDYRPDGYQKGENVLDITAPSTDAAKQWQGWGTALKPAMEPITMARKPLAGTVAVNVLAHGTGGINIDGCRVEGPGGVKWETPRGGIWTTDSGATAKLVQNDQGRWPANLIHDGSEEVVGLFPNAGNGHWSYKPAKDGGIYKYGLKDMPDGGSDKTVSSAARFFYCAKASRSERNAGLKGMKEREWHGQMPKNDPNYVRSDGAVRTQNLPRQNHHPTVKPIALMRYLVRLVTPPGGIVLDPFAGSGSTGVACAEEGFGFIGIEREAEYCEIARARIENRGGLFCTSNKEFK